MPETLKTFLTDLPTDKAEELHEWLDSEPMALSRMLEQLEETHPDLPLL